jgi:serine/threonine protein kinase/tetratricopeptide (TPR) repeat protein
MMPAPLGPERWRVVSPHLDRALELPGDERDAFLAALRAEDPSLAADLETLLGSHEALSEQGFLDEALLLAKPAASLAGQVMGAYTLLSPIGRGGMGSVWLAERSDGRFRGEAAVKLLNASLVGRDGDGRFRREGSILARLQHPHIAHLIDAGVSPQGQPYLVLERVNGERIDSYCDARGLGLDARIRLFLDVLAAVAHAHANLVVHRDLKPSNVLVDATGQVKLLDFGIAKLLESDTGDTMTALTRDGESLLTPQYAAPEQLTGGDVTTATDIHALGVLLYVLLTGRHPAGERPKTPADLVRAIVDTEPLRPSDAVTEQAAVRGRDTTVRRLKASLRGDLDNIVGKAIKKIPSERYRSVTLLAEDLARYLAHLPVSAQSDSVVYRARKFVRRHRTGVMLGAAAVVGMLSASAFAVAQMWDARLQRDAAILETRKAVASNELTRLVIAEGMQPQVMRGRLDRARKLLAGPWIDDPRIRAHLLLQLIPRYTELGEVTAREELLVEVRKNIEQVDDPALSAAVLCVEGIVHVDAGRFDQAATSIDQGLQLLARAPRTESQPWPECLLADVFRNIRIGRSGEAHRRATAAVAWMEEHDQRHTVLYTDAVQALGAAASSHGRYGEALTAIRKAMAVTERLSGDHSTAFVAKSGEVVVLRSGGKVIEARDTLDRLLAEVPRTSDADNAPDFLLTIHGRLLGTLARYDEAIPLLQQALARGLASGRQGPAVDTRAFLLEFLAESGRLEEAHELVRTVARSPAGEPPASTQGGMWWLLAKVRLLVASGQPALAAESLAVAQGILASRSDDPRARVTAILTAELALAKGDVEKACASASTAVERAQEQAIDPESSAWIGEALLMRARCHLGRGDATGARRDAAQAAVHLDENLGPTHPLSRQARQLVDSGRPTPGP